MRRIAPIALTVSMTALCASPALARLRYHMRTLPRQVAPIIRVALHFSTLKPPGKVRGGIELIRMAPNTTYTVAVFSSPELTLPFTPIVAGTLTTNDVGAGNRAINVERIPGSTVFFVMALSPGRGPSYCSSAVELG
jgi:hypothetical protein